jgi:hypothetical protein
VPIPSPIYSRSLALMLGSEFQLLLWVKQR